MRRALYESTPGYHHHALTHSHHNITLGLTLCRLDSCVCLVADEFKLAVSNALRYFPAEHHALLMPEFVEEVRAYTTCCRDWICTLKNALLTLYNAPLTTASHLGTHLHDALPPDRLRDEGEAS